MTTLALTTGKRKIKDGSRFNKYFPPQTEAYGNYKVLRHNGDVYKTVQLITQIIKNDAGDTAKIAPLLKGNTRLETLQNIHRFMVDYLQYDTERGEKLRSPRRTWWVGQTQTDKETGDTGVDCDDLVIFSGSILYNLGIPFFIRIVKINSNKFQHVYLVVPPAGDSLNGNTYYTLDGVLSEFNYEYPFKQENTFDMNGVKIEYLGNLSGTDDLFSLRTMLESYLMKISTGAVKTTKIGTADVVKMLEYVLKNWDDPETRIKALKLVAEKESEYYPEQQFFKKLYQFESSKQIYLSGNDGPNPDFNHDGTEDPDGSWNNNSGSGSDGKGKGWLALTALFNAIANFDWGLIDGTSGQPVHPPYQPPQPEPVKSQIAGFSLKTVGSVVLIGGLSYLLYQNWQAAKDSKNRIAAHTGTNINRKQLRQ